MAGLDGRESFAEQHGHSTEEGPRVSNPSKAFDAGRETGYTLAEEVVLEEGIRSRQQATERVYQRIRSKPFAGDSEERLAWENGRDEGILEALDEHLPLRDTPPVVEDAKEEEGPDVDSLLSEAHEIRTDPDTDDREKIAHLYTLLTEALNVPQGARLSDSLLEGGTPEGWAGHHDVEVFWRVREERRHGSQPVFDYRDTLSEALEHGREWAEEERPWQTAVYVEGWATNHSIGDAQPLERSQVRLT